MRMLTKTLILLILSVNAYGEGKGKVGDWFFVIEKDILEEKNKVFLGVPSDQGSDKKLGMICDGVSVDRIILDFGKFVGLGEATVKYKIDQNDVISSNADFATNGAGVVFSKASTIYDHLYSGKKLTVRAYDSNQVPTETLTFSIEGLKELTETKSVCLVAF